MRNTRSRRRGRNLRYRSSLYSIRFLEDLRDFPNAPSVLSEGDSWFGYPFGKDLNDQIAELGSFNIRHFEKAGDELVDDMMDGRQKKLITKALKENQFELMLYSGGGNDVVAKNLENYISDDSSGVGPHNRVIKAATEARVQELKNKYIALIELVAEHQRACPIVVHGYTGIIPSDEGFEILGFKLTGPWVKPTLDKKGVPPEQQADVINYIMDLFNRMLLSLSEQYENFHYIDLRVETLTKSEWANEIHPSSAGFKKLAVHYKDTLKKLVPKAFEPAASVYRPK
ncbi:hypothetical protein [Glaciecola sp. SC05]|uniref:hypothetical protein n=1 Tax=Glaciecola sp. SC05 TaxID=1987355 RepID=UPI0035295017